MLEIKTYGTVPVFNSRFVKCFFFSEVKINNFVFFFQFLSLSKIRI